MSELQIIEARILPARPANEMAREMTSHDVAALITAFREQNADLKQIKDSVYTLLIKVGFFNEDGTVRENLNIKSLTGLAMQFITGGDKVKRDFGFLADLLPLVEKYKHL